MNALTAGLTQSYGRKLTIAEAAVYAGLSTSTMFDWLTWSKLRQIESAIGLLEALPPSERKRIVNNICRILPTIDSQCISWSESQVSRLRQVLQKATGFTIVQGDENPRGFVVTALGHSALRISPPVRKVLGLDVRWPCEFVPVPGVVYLNAPLDPDVLQQRTSMAWPSVKRSENCMIVLNGVWHAESRLHAEIRSLAESNHVVLGEAFGFTAAQAAKAGFNQPHLVTASDAGKRRIKIAIQAI